MNVKQLRQLIRQRRMSLSPSEQSSAALNLAHRVIQLPEYQSASRTAIYIENDGEVATRNIIEHAWQASKQVLLPVLNPDQTGSLVFLPYTKSTLMIDNKYGIPEPKFRAENVLDIDAIDIIFVPLVAFDHNGNRMGMGGGFYDRTLAKIDRTQTRLIGLAHDCQEVEQLQTESWDVPMDMILTPSKEIYIS